MNRKQTHKYKTICTEMNVVHEHLIWLDGTRFEEEEEKKRINNNTQITTWRKIMIVRRRLLFFDHFGMNKTMTTTNICSYGM